MNPSFEIVRRLPTALPGVEIIAHPEPLKVAYHTLLKSSVQLIEKHNPTIVLHIGVAARRDYFAVEQSSLRNGYDRSPDTEGRVLTKADAQNAWGEGSPESLSSSFDLESVVALWKRHLVSSLGKLMEQKAPQHKQLADVRLSDNVGSYGCGLLYYSSLAELHKTRGGHKNAVFLHVPQLSGDLEYEMGKEVTIALILALAESLG